ncbi:MAG: L,D-transpeptidase [Acidimicrobiia bacterium]
MPAAPTRDGGRADAYGAAAVADAIATAAACGAAIRWTGPPERVRPAAHAVRTVLHVAVALVLCTVAAAVALRLTGTRSPHADAEELVAVPAAVAPAPVDLPGPQVLPAGFSAWSGTLATAATARSSPDPDAAAVADLAPRNEFGDPQTLALVAQTWGSDGAAWVQVQLPVRPNGTTGWLPASALAVEGRTMRIEVHTGSGELVLYDHDAVAASWPVAIGPDRFPTPHGSFFVWTKYYDGPPAAYGPGVLGLSGFSEVLDSSNWPGDARIGIHGAATEESLGGRAGHGCVRMRSTDVAGLLADVPLGTPVVVTD